MKPLLKATVAGTLLTLGIASTTAATATREQLLEGIQRLIEELDSNVVTEDDDFESFCEYKKRILETAARKGIYKLPIPEDCPPSGKRAFFDDDAEDLSLAAWLKRVSEEIRTGS